MNNGREEGDSERIDIFMRLFPSQEVDAAVFMISNHRELVVDLPQGVLKFFNDSLNSLPKTFTNEIRLSEWVCRLLIGRLIQDIRSMSLCASLSYSTGTASIASSIFEIAFELMFLTANEEAAQAWLDHKVIKEGSSKIGERIESYVGKLGFIGKEKTDMVQKYFEPYRLINMAKHGNSILQRNLNLKFDDENRKLTIAAGPDTSRESMAIIALSIEHALSSATAALARFFQEYYPNLSDQVIHTSDQVGIKLMVIRMSYPQIEVPG